MNIMGLLYTVYILYLKPGKYLSANHFWLDRYKPLVIIQLFREGVIWHGWQLYSTYYMAYIAAEINVWGLYKQRKKMSRILYFIYLTSPSRFRTHTDMLYTKWVFFNERRLVQLVREKIPKFHIVCAQLFVCIKELF